MKKYYGFTHDFLKKEANKRLVYDREFILVAIKKSHESFLYYEGRFKIDETLLKEFRKKFGKKLIDEYFG